MSIKYLQSRYVPYTHLNVFHTIHEQLFILKIYYNVQATGNPQTWLLLFIQQPTLTIIILYIVIKPRLCWCAFRHIPTELWRILCQGKWARILSQISTLRFKWANNRANPAGPVSALKQAQAKHARASTNHLPVSTHLPRLP